MYKIYCDGEMLWKPGVEDLVVLEPKAELELNKAGTMEFDLPMTHPLYEKTKKLESDIELYQDDKLLWKFRVLNDDKDFYNTKTVECEGDLAFLYDSIQRPYEYTGNIYNFFKKALDVHNSFVEKRKQFEMGTCNVVDSNNYINRSNGHHSRTLELLNDKLIETHGGYLRTRHVNGHNYLDYISDYGHTNTQVIWFGESLLDLTQYVKGEAIRTAIIPLGAETDTDGINEVKKRVDITSVNNGKDYIYSQAAVNLYGWHWEVVEFDDVTVPANLKKKAEAYLEESIAMQVSIELTAVDLSLVDVKIEAIHLGDWIRVISPPHGLNKLFLVSKLTLDLQNPENSKITLGSVFDTFSAGVSKDSKQISARIDRIAESKSREINDKIENATQLITGGKGGYIHLSYNTDGKPEEMLILNKPTVSSATTIIRLNKNGIGFSTTGINGPYRNAWTIDGNLVADFITVGNMLADRIRGGTLEVGGIGPAKDGTILVKDAAGNVTGRIDKSGIYLKGSLETRNGDVWAKVDSGGIHFGNGGTEYNRITCDEKITDWQNMGTVYTFSAFRGKDGVALCAPKLYVGDSQDAKIISPGWTGTTSFVKDIQDLGDGRIGWTYVHVGFKNGILITDPN